MSDDIPITRPWLGDAEARAVAAALGDRWVGQGPRVAEFEARLAQRVGAQAAVALSSGTAALHLALLALEVGPGDEVIVPALSFIATANAVRMAGARVVFADVEPTTLNLDPADVARRITERTRALVVAHQLGLPADMQALGELAHAHGLKVVEDAACALGSRLGDDEVGRPHGDLACFSFHPRKVITTGEGGAVTAREPEVLARLRRLRNHGAEATAEPSGGIRYVAVGYNYRMSDLHAAVGLVQLDRLDEILRRRREIARRYDARLRKSEHLALPEQPLGVTPNYQSYHVTLSPDAPCSVTELIDTLAQQGVSARGGLTAIHREPVYHSEAPDPLPHTEALSRRGLMLPIFPELADDEVDRVCDGVLDALSGGSS